MSGVAARGRASGLLLLGDAATVAAAYALAAWLRFAGHPPAANMQALERALPLFVLGCVVLAQIYNLYERRPLPWPEEVQGIFMVVALNTLVAMAASFFVRSFAVPRTVVALAAVLNLLLLLAYRGLAYRRWRARVGLPTVLYVRAPDSTWEPNGTDGSVFSICASVVVNDDDPAIPVVVEALRRSGARGLLLDEQLRGPVKELLALLALERGYELFLVPRILDLVLLQSRPTTFGDSLVVDLTSAPDVSRQRFLKRMIDVSLGLLLLVVTSPLLLLAVVLAWLDDGRPVLYRQERMGRYGKRFNVVKIRTMRRDAEAATGPILATTEDPRVTRVGRFLRRVHLDELPQLWNILRGDMSLVGPRPERPAIHDEVAQDLPQFHSRLAVMPGLTGLAQVRGKYDTSPREKIKFDLLYSLRSSAAMDAQILLRTVRAVLGSLSRTPPPPPAQ